MYLSTLPPQEALPTFWQNYFKTADEAIAENFWGNLEILQEAYQSHDAYALQLQSAGYQFDKGFEKPAPFYNFVKWALKELNQLLATGVAKTAELLIPAKAFAVEAHGEKTYQFICIGQEPPPNSEELNLLTPKMFVDMLSAGFFPLGAPIREHTNQTLCEHDMAHICGFISSPRYMKSVRQAFEQVQLLMEKNPLVKEALHHFDSLYSLRLYYMIEIFSEIPQNNVALLEERLAIKLSDFSLEHEPEQIYPKVIALLKSKTPAELNEYLHKFYSDFTNIINPLGGESRDILNRTRKFSRANQAGSFYATMSNLESKFDGSSIYSMWLNAKAALINKRSNHSDYHEVIEQIHAPFIAAMVGTSQLTIEDWVMQAVQEYVDPNSTLYKYICNTKLWNKSHMLYWAYGFHDCTKVLTHADFTRTKVYFDNDELVNTLKQIKDIKDKFTHQNKTECLPDGKSISTRMMITRFEKYNVPKVAEVLVTEEAINQLLQHDNSIKGLPRFIADFLNMKPSQSRETLDRHPEFIEWFVKDTYLLMPNPEQTSHAMLMNNPLQLRSNKTGFGLIAWYIHPLILKNSQYASRETIIQEAKSRGESLRYGDAQNQENLQKIHRVHSFSFLSERDEEQLTKEELVQQSGVPYFSGPFDFTVEQLADLCQLKEGIMHHLQTHYGVTAEDKVDLYFHTHYSIDTNTAHLHVRVNQLHHGLELDKSISLDEVIDYLQQGKSVKSKFIERRCLHTELKKLSFLSNLGYEAHEVNNPYRLNVREEDDVMNYQLIS